MQQLRSSCHSHHDKKQFFFYLHADIQFLCETRYCKRCSKNFAEITANAVIFGNHLITYTYCLCNRVPAINIQTLAMYYLKSKVNTTATNAHTTTFYSTNGVFILKSVPYLVPLSTVFFHIAWIRKVQNLQLQLFLIKNLVWSIKNQYQRAWCKYPFTAANYI